MTLLKTLVGLSAVLSISSAGVSLALERVNQVESLEETGLSEYVAKADYLRYAKNHSNILVNQLYKMRETLREVSADPLFKPLQDTL